MESRRQYGSASLVPVGRISGSVEASTQSTREAHIPLERRSPIRQDGPAARLCEPGNRARGIHMYGLSCALVRPSRV